MSYESTHGRWAFDQMVADDLMRDDRVAVSQSKRSVERVALLHATDALHAAWDNWLSEERSPMSWIPIAASTGSPSALLSPRLRTGGVS